MKLRFQFPSRHALQTIWAAIVLSASAFYLLPTALGGSSAQAQTNTPLSETYSSNEIVNAGHQFFGDVSGGLASVVERAFQNYGLPNAYILGEEGSGAIIGGLVYGEGLMYTSLCCRRRWHDRTGQQQYNHCAGASGYRCPARGKYRLFEIHPPSDMESVLVMRVLNLIF